MKMYQVGIREFKETSYGETSYPFESNLPFDWFDPTNPSLEGVEDFLSHLGYDTEGLKFSPTGVEGIGITGDHLDLVITFPERTTK